MLVKCAWCQNTFNSERYGRQFCPHCGAELDLAVPGGAAGEPVRVLRPGEGAGLPEAETPAPGPVPGEAGPAQPDDALGAILSGSAQGPYGGPGAPGGAGPGGYGPPGGGPGGYGPGGYGPPGAAWASLPQDQPSPWERREELGAINSLIETWKQASLRPEQFFSRLRPDPIGPAFWYALIFGSLGTLFLSFWVLIFEVAFGMGDAPWAAFGNLVSSPISAAINVWIASAILHVGCLLFRCADRGFEATFRACAYSYGPQILGIIPIIGTFIGGIWCLVLEIIAVKNMQRTTTARAAGAVLLPMILGLILCSCIGATLFLAGFGALAGGAAFK